MLLTVLPAAAEGQNAIVRSDPAQLEVNAGQIATLSVVLADAQNVYGIDVSATFDPQLVEVVDADPAKEGVQATPGAFPKPDFVARNVADNQAGTLRYAVTQVNPTEPVSGSGVIFTVQFRAKAPSGQSAFTIASVDLTDLDGIALGVQPESGMIRIMPAGQATPTTAAPTAHTHGDHPTGAHRPNVDAGRRAVAYANSHRRAARANVYAYQSAGAGCADKHAGGAGRTVALARRFLRGKRSCRRRIARWGRRNRRRPSQPILRRRRRRQLRRLKRQSPLRLRSRRRQRHRMRRSTAALWPRPIWTPSAWRLLKMRQARCRGDSPARRMRTPNRPPRVDPSKLLLIVGVVALAVAAVTALLMVVILRR